MANQDESTMQAQLAEYLRKVGITPEDYINPPVIRSDTTAWGIKAGTGVRPWTVDTTATSIHESTPERAMWTVEKLSKLGSVWAAQSHLGRRTAVYVEFSPHTCQWQMVGDIPTVTDEVMRSTQYLPEQHTEIAIVVGWLSHELGKLNGVRGVPQEHIRWVLQSFTDKLSGIAKRIDE